MDADVVGPEEIGLEPDGASQAVQNEIRKKVLQCPYCGTMTMRREKRHGWLEQKLLPRLGLYPWECSQCRESRYFRDRGGKKRGSKDATDQD